MECVVVRTTDSLKIEFSFSEADLVAADETVLRVFRAAAENGGPEDVLRALIEWLARRPTPLVAGRARRIISMERSG